MNLSAFVSYLRRRNKTDVIFDFDETLVHLLVDWSRWSHRLYKLFHTTDPHLQALNPNEQQIQNEFIKKYGEEMRDRIVQINYEAERDDMRGYNLLSPQFSWLPELKSEFTLHLWTSNDKRTIIPLMQKLHIDHYFKTVTTRNDVYCIKPEMDGFIKINAEQKSLESFIMIGDSTSDSGAAKNAGIDFLHVSEFKN